MAQISKIHAFAGGNPRQYGLPPREGKLDVNVSVCRWYDISKSNLMRKQSPSLRVFLISSLFPDFFLSILSYPERGNIIFSAVIEVAWYLSSHSSLTLVIVNLLQLSIAYRLVRCRMRSPAGLGSTRRYFCIDSCTSQLRPLLTNTRHPTADERIVLLRCGGTPSLRTSRGQYARTPLTG